MDYLTMKPPDGVPPEIGLWTFALEDQRKRTLEFADGLTNEQLEWTPPGVVNSIGCLLYHLAGTEMGWLFEDIWEKPVTDEVKALLPFPYRGDDGNLHAAKGVSLAEHVERLHATRRILIDAAHALTLEQFMHERKDPGGVYVATPQWILYHLLEHEAHHAGQINTIRQQLSS